MRFVCVRIAILLSATIAASGQAQVAADNSAEFPPIYTMSPKGVNLQTGRYVASSTEFSVGPLDFVRHMGGPAFFQGTNNNLTQSFGHWGHNHSHGIKNKNSAFGATNRLVVVNGAELEFFHPASAGAPYQTHNHASQGWMLTHSGTTSTATNSNGDAFIFENLTSSVGVGPLSRIEYADGHRVTYSYDASSRPRLVSSNRGYAIIIDYGANGQISTACGFNSANTFVSTATTCASTAALVKTSYVYNADLSMASVTQTNGSVVYFTYGSNGAQRFPATISLPNAPTTYAIQNFYGPQDGEMTHLTRPYQVRRQITASGNTWLYRYQPYELSDLPPQPGELRDTYSYVTSPDGTEIEAKYINGIVKYVTGPVYKEYAFSGMQPTSIKHAEGNEDTYVVDYAGNTTSVTRKPKPGSGLANITSSTTYPTANIWSSPTICNAASQKLCNKPIAIVDERGNQSDFTYDPAHGGVLTKTGPAVNGIRPQTRYTYVQRFATVRTSATTFGQAISAIWLLAQEAYCKSGNPNATNTGCAVAGDEVITTYEYGPTTTTAANNLFLRGIVVDPGGLHLRTCYAYDAQGNKISERKPLGAGTTTCP